MSTICPYPGLRPFNENESIFFKGRDEHIKKIIAQLAKNKFVMITGASGDGKSSLIYAGVIPNAKAGFFKAKHNNWIVADFRPERSPVTNMAAALTRQLGYHDQQQVEKELGYGFSSLVDLYTKSEFALDTSAEAFLQADAETQKQSKRKAANLLILVDQFEELFTNAENYCNDQPSIEAQTAVNLLIETSRIALEKDIPIYVVCTMRSDYIGQCSAFRGLPELIGFSQFFVPRLKRKEIQQVIVDPAILSGNRISNRLTQTLINELGDGLDQLPVLQHALNQIWKAAGDGTSEMDLIHLAKAGGLKREQLPEEDKATFDEWYNTLPEFKKALLKKPSLENVLNAHANELYETAHEVYNQTHETPISQQTAQFIIKKAFQGLTKTDQGRTVRNRMTLQEITNVIYSDAVTTEMVGAVLDIFRMPGNTFLRPFVNSESEYRPLKSSDILDITHESLIRNWRLLSSWAGEEYQNILTFRDFQKQTERWDKSSKSSDYLLPIGPLTYFEGWQLKEKPNKYLIAKYNEDNIPEKNKLSDSEYWLNMGQLFINRSARKLFFTRFVMKYGAARIAATMAAFIVVGVGIYFFLDHQSKLNKNVLPKIEEQCFSFLNNKTVSNKEKANFLVNEEILHPGSLEKNLERLKGDSVVIDVTLAIAGKILQISEYQQVPLPDFAPSIFKLLCNTIKQYTDANAGRASEKKIERIVQFIDMLDFVSNRHIALYKSLEAQQISNDAALFVYGKYIEPVLTDTASKQFDGVLLFNSLQRYMIAHKEDTSNFKKLVYAISPFCIDGSERFNKLFPRNTTVKFNYWGGGEITSKGGYLILSSLYSGLGDYENITRSIDSLYTQNRNYSEAFYGSFGDVVNFCLYFTQFNEKNFKILISNYAKVSLLDKAVIVQKVMTNIGNVEYFQLDKGTSYLSLKALVSKEHFNIIWDYYNYLLSGKTIGEQASEWSDLKDEKLFALCNYYKVKGLKIGRVYSDSVEATKNFERFGLLFNKISRAYLNKEEIFKVSGRVFKKKNSDLLLFPDDLLYAISIRGWDLTWIRQTRSSIFFQKYIIRQGLQKFYTTDNNDLLLRLIYQYNEGALPDECDAIKVKNSKELFRDEFIDSVKAFVNATNNSTIKEEGILELYDIVNKFRSKKDKEALTMLDKFGSDKMLKCFKSNQTDFKRTQLLILIKNMAAYLAINNRHSHALEVIATLDVPYEQRNAFIVNSQILLFDRNQQNSSLYTDSVMKIIGEDNRFGLTLLSVLGRHNTKDYDDNAIDLISRLGENRKNDALSNYVFGKAAANEYYKAKKTIPQFLSRDREFKMWNGIIGTHIRLLMIDKKIEGKDLQLVTVNSPKNFWANNDWETPESASDNFSD